MFKPSRKKVVKAKEKVTFKLELNASNVPQRGWDKLLVSLVSLESGKVTSRTGKSLVKNGTCQWLEPLFESILVSQDSTGKFAGKELYKLAVSTGLSRFGSLGDAIVNLMDFVHTIAPVSLSLPLQNCNFGSVIHVKVQRIWPKSPSRNMEDQKEDLTETVLDGDRQSEPDLVISRDNVATSEENFPRSNQGDAFFLSPSRSIDSVDVPSTPLMEESRLHGRDGVGDEEFMSLSSSVSSSGRHELDGAVYDGEFPSSETLFKPGQAVDNYSSSPRHSKSSPDGNILLNGECSSPGSSLPVSYEENNKWETSQRRTRLQRRASVAMPSSWEHDANQVAVAELEVLKQQLANETKRSEEVHKKLSMLIAERDSIKQEMEDLKSREDLKWQRQGEEEGNLHTLKELQDELDYVKGMNMNLSVQLEKTQESNTELLLEIQDLEKLLQEKELEKQSNEFKPKCENGVMEDAECDLRKLVDTLQKELVELERDSQELTEENLDLLSQLKQVKDELKDKDELIAKLEMENTHGCVGKCGDNLIEKLRVSEEARLLLLECQSQSLLEKLTKAEDDHSKALVVIENLESALQRLDVEKGETIAALEKQVRDSNEQFAVSSESYKEALKVMEGMEAERADFLVAREQTNELEVANARLREQLQKERLKTSKARQEIIDSDVSSSSQLQQALSASQAQVKSMELILSDLEGVRQGLEREIQSLHEKERLNRSRIEELELHTVTLEDEIVSLNSSRVLLEAEVRDLKALKERQKSQEDTVNWSKQSKVGLEENFLHVQEANNKGSRRPLEEKNEMELQELKTRVFYLEEELQRKVTALASAERRLGEQRDFLSYDGSTQVSYLTRSLSRANSRVGAKPTIPPSREAKELSDLRDKVKLLESELKSKAAELEASKEQLKEQYTLLSMRIEQLEMANEELVKEHSNSNLDQALKELNNLQNQNATMFQRENELLSRLASQEALQLEVEILKEEKKELESVLSRFNVAAKGENILKRISNLETELAEALESNIMYKTQLQSAFAKQQNVHAAALESLGSVDKVIKDLAELKRKNSKLEDELCDMKERYFNMSLQFAEVEAEREELVMAIRNLRGTKKFAPLRSAIF